MSYLEIIERLKTDPQSTSSTPSVREPGNETNEKNEISPLGELPPLVGRRNARGEIVLTLEDLPELENRLRLQGWKVKRQGVELICTSPGGLRTQ
jgi:hypothetical protein